jgi:hypothetical protein
MLEFVAERCVGIAGHPFIPGWKDHEIAVASVPMGASTVLNVLLLGVPLLAPAKGRGSSCGWWVGPARVPANSVQRIFARLPS